MTEDWRVKSREKGGRGLGEREYQLYAKCTQDPDLFQVNDPSTYAMLSYPPPTPTPPSVSRYSVLPSLPHSPTPPLENTGCPHHEAHATAPCPCPHHISSPSTLSDGLLAPLAVATSCHLLLAHLELLLVGTNACQDICRVSLVHDLLIRTKEEGGVKMDERLRGWVDVKFGRRRGSQEDVGGFDLGMSGALV